MTRLSEALHGAADRAPVDEATISVPRAARRVRLNRAARGSANGLAGIAAVALVAAGVFNPGSGGEADSAAAEAAPPQAGEDALFDGAGANGSADMATTRLADWGTCGTSPLNDWGWGSTEFSLSPDLAAEELDGGATVDVPVAVTANGDYEVTTAGPVAVVLWDGMVVARADANATADVLTEARTAGANNSVALDLVSCFDGEPLPPSKYELLVSQTFQNVALVATEPEALPPAEPGAEPEPDPIGPSIEPGPNPTPTVATLPDESGTADDTTTLINSAPDGCMFGPADELICEGDFAPDVPPFITFRAVAEPIPFVVAGEPVEDPFAEYIPEPWTPPAPPEDALTPEIAQRLFDDAATTAPWDMAPGSSRWALRSGDDDWSDTYFGCAWDGADGASFPRRTADLGLVDLEATVPSRIEVSYGWVVEDNPRVSLVATNVSPYQLPGLAYGAPRNLLLVDSSGQVVAEAWPTDLDPYAADVIALESGVGFDAVSESALVPGNYWGLLAPGGSTSGEYLWREVTSCWAETGQRELRPGTYTVLVTQQVHLDGYSGWGREEIDGLDTGDVLNGPDDGADIDLPGTAVSYGWAELQVWFSLGTVSVATT